MRELNAEFCGIELAVPAGAPRIACGEELVARHIEHVMPDLKVPFPNVIKLCIEQYPAFLNCVPVFADPMVLEISGIEISAKSAARAGGDALVAQQRDRHQHEMVTDADNALGWRPQNRQWRFVHREQGIEHSLKMTDMTFASLLVGDLYTVEV